MAGNEETSWSSGRHGLLTGTVLNGIYRIEERLGGGGMGEVYRATNLANDEQDAIKIIGRGLADHPEMEALLRKEARVLRRIQSPAVAQFRLLARDPALSLLYLASEFVAGTSLLERLEARPASEAELRAILRRMLTGLAAVHAAGAVHRDVSPDNIILPDGKVEEAKLIDFGIVKETDPTHTTIIGDRFAGKYGYIAPEQLGFSNSRIGPWTDLYALALVGIAFAAGKPLGMGNSLGTAEEARRAAIPLEAIPPTLRRFFAELLVYDWSNRVASAEAALSLLDATVIAPSLPPERGTATDPPAAAERPPRRRRWWLIVPAALLVLLLGAGLGWLAVFDPDTGASRIVTPTPSVPMSPRRVAARAGSAMGSALAALVPAPLATPSPSPLPTPSPTVESDVVTDDTPIWTEACRPGPYVIFFDWDGTAINEEAEQVLVNAVKAYGDCPGARIRLDAVAGADEDAGIAEARAATVRRLLRAAGGAAQAPVIVSTRLVGDEGGRAPQNRRVEISYER